MSIPKTSETGGGGRIDSGDGSYDGTETVSSSRAGAGDGVDRYDGLGSVSVRDHRTLLDSLVGQLFGRGPNWAEIIKEEGGVERLLDAANNPSHPDHESAQKFLETEAGSRAMQLQIQKNGRRAMLWTNTMQALYQIQKAILQNIRV